MPYRAPNRHGVTPQGRGRFPGFDVLDEVPRWDDVTAGVVLARLQPHTDLAFFTAAENAVATPLCDLLLEQDTEPRVPVVALIDARLAAGETDGWRYDDMPPDPQAWRDTLAALDQDAEQTHGTGFGRLGPGDQAALIHAMNEASVHKRSWHDWPAHRVWSLWTRYACAAFYSHPWAWNEIGFGGPAYPRGYKNVGLDARERWEVADQEDGDPVAFADRIERARDRHETLTGHRAPPPGAISGRQGGGQA
ncbi:gluconate 2-dehydrogenase subunit 3 family protein [Allobranchiibius sp. GilTou73]|uniref:gluconate 2-dehydrogenase subunit 3 family protein n=1 Tax=Allobranchiibius sp. GilTou73 TaxID=2904523 RepID=UPI001F472D74|nr:gluconate 2-dehydrogenase subunit 3 family protein [Allobranchiibius sp. GilTou73]UIJ34313.1 gluconate 2-dehydrogenase subunit 3 family protein [Allobranchiibius sp. GilTou73]